MMNTVINTGRLALLATLTSLAVALVGTSTARADAGIFYVPAAPRTGDTVTFDGSSACGTGGVVCRWDLDGDGFGNNADEPASPRVAHVFASPGPHVVRLLADSRPVLGTKAYEVTVRVVDRPPVAAILAPRTAGVGARVTFVSLARDPDNGLASESWDLNGDGVFGDAKGPVARRTFTAAGRRTIALRVVDRSGAVAVARATVLVTPARPLPLNPFPVVRARGQLLAGGIRLQRLSVMAPRSATINVRCTPSCGTQRTAGTGRTLRLRRFERELRVGVVLELRVTGARRLGKFVSFRVVGGSRGYVRKDACLVPGSTRPVACGG